MNRLPPWFLQDIPDSAVLDRVETIGKSRVHTVCKEAHCPNINRCLKNKQLTFLILGDACTRACSFCAVRKAQDQRGPVDPLEFVDPREPENVCAVVRKWDIEYVVLTSVTRDDLSDGGAAQFRDCVKAIRSSGRSRKIEVLVPDFLGNTASVRTVSEVYPEVFGHNIETVKRLYKEIRPQADYYRSLAVLKAAKDFNRSQITKSSLMLGLGENEYDVYGAMEDLRKAGVDIITLGQYLAPSKDHYPVAEYVDPGQFGRYADAARQFGFKAVLSDPVARSSYRAQELYEAIKC